MSAPCGHLLCQLTPGTCRLVAPPRIGRGKWSQPGVPHKGWACVGVADLGARESGEERLATCEMCESTEIRYVHTMVHPDYPESLGCGCVCAGHMESDPDRARAREAAAKNRSARRDRWLARDWKWTKKGNATLKVGDARVTVFQHRDERRRDFSVNLHGFVIHRGRDAEFSESFYETPDDAKLAAFDALYEGQS